ncbi:MAG: hydrogenase maturation nickel metallochaperone HypA [Candidatus Omnitrophica bacterium]|nr:hydrogenase maturation nickel metallochaperone HypA [Candidatus Omnitrophota bacterium]
MHELKIVTILVDFLEKFCQEKKPEKVLGLTLRINPYSCLSQESLSLAFSTLTKDKPLLKQAKLKLVRNEDPTSQEVVVESVEILT